MSNSGKKSSVVHAGTPLSYYRRSPATHPTIIGPTRPATGPSDTTVVILQWHQKQRMDRHNLVMTRHL